MVHKLMDGKKKPEFPAPALSSTQQLEKVQSIRYEFFHDEMSIFTSHDNMLLFYAFAPMNNNY